MRLRVVHPVFKLIGNENMKIYLRLRTWIMLALLVLAIVLVAVVIVTHQPATSAGWQQALRAQTTQLQQRLSQASHMPAAAVSQIQAQIQVNQYDIAHNINPSLTTGWGFAATAQNLSSLLIAFILVIAGDIMASEFSTGTIKMLLTQTATRSKIFVAKYLSMLLYGLFATAFMFVASMVVGWIFFGTSGAGQPHIYVNAAHNVAQMNAVSYLLMQYGFLLIQIIITATIAFMISTIFRSSALAITISLLAFLVGRTIVQALSSYDWVKYILFAYTDLSQFVVDGPTIKGLTLSFSITMLVAYFVVMMGLAWAVFSRRDVAYT